MRRPSTRRITIYPWYERNPSADLARSCGLRLGSGGYCAVNESFVSPFTRTSYSSPGSKSVPSGTTVSTEG